MQDPVDAASAFLIRQLAGRQADLNGALARLATLEALIRALELAAGEEAAELRGACESERDQLVARIGGLLYAWQIAGGHVALTPPDTSSATADGAAATEGDAAPALPADPSPDADEPAPPAVAARTDLATREDLERLLRSFGPDRTLPEPEPARPGFDPRENVLRLGPLLERVRLPPPGEPLMGADLDRAVAQVIEGTAALDEEWGPLAPAYQRPLLSLYAAFARHLQSLMAEDDPARQKLNAVFPRLSAFSRQYQPGSVHGLAFIHTPLHGTWLDDAYSWLAQLRELAGHDTAPPVAPKMARPVSVTIDRLLRDLGFTAPKQQAPVRALLAGRGHSPKVRSALDGEQQNAIRAFIRDRRLRICTDECKRLRAELFGMSDQSVRVDTEFCDVCEGSNNRRATLAMVRCFKDRGITRLLVIGGGDDARADLAHTLADWHVQMREVDGTKSASQKDADNDMGWAQVMVVWGGTQLPHKVSNLFRKPPDSLIAVNPNRRSVEALCRAVIERVCPDGAGVGPPTPWTGELGR